MSGSDTKRSPNNPDDGALVGRVRHPRGSLILFLAHYSWWMAIIPALGLAAVLDSGLIFYVGYGGFLVWFTYRCMTSSVSVERCPAGTDVVVIRNIYRTVRVVPRVILKPRTPRFPDSNLALQPHLRGHDEAGRIVEVACHVGFRYTHNRRREVVEELGEMLSEAKVQKRTRYFW